MKECLFFALQPALVKRALKYAILVGAILIAINHADAILRGQMDIVRSFKMGFTMIVPCVVSTLSSVAAMRELQKRQTCAN